MPIMHFTNEELQDQVADAERQIQRLENERDELSDSVSDLTTQRDAAREEVERLRGLLSDVSDIVARA
jgi:uncharacterized coiled-coil DUF342 family protein